MIQNIILGMFQKVKTKASVFFIKCEVVSANMFTLLRPIGPHVPWGISPEMVQFPPEDAHYVCLNLGI